MELTGLQYRHPEINHNMYRPGRNFLRILASITHLRIRVYFTQKKILKIRIFEFNFPTRRSINYCTRADVWLVFAVENLLLVLFLTSETIGALKNIDQ